MYACISFKIDENTVFLKEELNGDVLLKINSLFYPNKYPYFFIW